MDLKPLTTTAEVMDALGGIRAVAALTGRKYTAAANWRRFPTFPSNTYVIMTDALRQVGYQAPHSLWGMESQQEAIGEVSEVVPGEQP